MIEQIKIHSQHHFIYYVDIPLDNIINGYSHPGVKTQALVANLIGENGTCIMPVVWF